MKEKEWMWHESISFDIWQVEILYIKSVGENVQAFCVLYFNEYSRFHGNKHKKNIANKFRKRKKAFELLELILWDNNLINYNNNINQPNI